MITIFNDHQFHSVLWQIFKISIYFANLQVKGILQHESIAKNLVFFILYLYSEKAKRKLMMKLTSKIV